MTRHVWPNALLLHCVELIDAHAAKLTAEVAAQVLPKPQDEYGPPVALRWSSNPALGFPRKPFTVYRRPTDFKQDRTLLDGSQEIKDGAAVFSIAGLELYEVRFTVAPAAGSTLTVQALDAHDRPIPHQRIVFNAPGLGAIRCAGVAALRISGQGVVSSIIGMTGDMLANQYTWQRIAVVGLPFDPSEISSPHYDSTIPQGYEPPSDDPLSAAERRLKAAFGLTLPIPALPAGYPTPDWPLYDPLAPLATVRVGDGLLEAIGKCLHDSIDSDPFLRQSAYRVDRVLDGVRQVDQGLPPGSEQAHASLPVVAMAQLAITTESDAAVALGFGHTDFPPPFEVKQDPPITWPPGQQPPPFLYMVEAEYELPFAGTLTIAALAHVRPPPVPALGLVSQTLQRNRAPVADAPETSAVELAWDLATPPVGYAVAVSHAPGSVDLLNAKRIGGPGRDLFVPQRRTGPDGQAVPGSRSRFVDPLAPVPFAGSLTSTYFLVPRDVFARWSLWRQVDDTRSAPAVTRPGLESARIDGPAAPPAAAQVASTLTIEFSWDWSDRSPARVELTGRFYTTADPPASYLGGLERDATLGGDPVLSIGFNATRDPIAPAGISAHRLTPDGEARCRYRVVVPNVQCDYSGGSKLRYAVYARGYEAVRPTSGSDVVGPRDCEAADPRPAPPPPLPEILWTALPDATGTARALLTWPASQGGAPATGYFVWEATETALRQAVALPPVPSNPTPSLPVRAGELRDHIQTSALRRSQSEIAFTRLNERAIAANQIELELPGSADTLYVYRISTVTGAGVESARSTGMAFVGVPRRAVPGEPGLLLRRTPGGVRIYALRGAGVVPVGYAVHRVRNPNATAEVGMMGPPAIAHDHPGWQAPTPGDPALRGQDPLQVRVFEDPVPIGWDAHYYRLVAVGPHDPAQGVYSGRSRASAVQSIVRAPAGPPLLDQLAVTASATNTVLSFRTDLPIRTCPLGPATIAVSATDTSGGALTRTLLLAVESDEVASGPAFAVLPAPTPAQLAAMPQISRGAPDSERRVVYSVRLPGEVVRGVVTVTDPLGRAIERALPEVP